MIFYVYAEHYTMDNRQPIHSYNHTIHNIAHSFKISVLTLVYYCILYSLIGSEVNGLILRLALFRDTESVIVHLK
jgi:hypothetical protein